MSYGDTINVDFGHLAQAEADMAGSQKVIGDRLNALSANLRPLFACWTGDGGEMYTQQQNRLLQAMGDLNGVLNQIHVAIGTANSQYQANERTVANAWGAV